MRTSPKDPLCTSQKLECVNRIEVDTARCMKPCSGLIVTSFRKDSLQINWEEKFPVLAAYDNYKIITQHPTGYNGMLACLLYVSIFDLKKNLLLLEYQWKNKLRFVRIYFDTPTFDRIEKDRAAKFVDMLSAIGGTMGLLTGFSIISGVEIIYFSAKIIWCILTKNKNNM